MQDICRIFRPYDSVVRVIGLLLVVVLPVRVGGPVRECEAGAAAAVAAGESTSCTAKKNLYATTRKR